jgi:hypothetical protein
MMRTGWKWDFAIPTRSVGGGIIRRAGVVVLSVLLGSETLSKVIINVVVRYFWVRGFFALCRWWRWCCGLALNRGKRNREAMGRRSKDSEGLVRKYSS